jgi:tRNA dimethylallyltransferase
VREAVESEIAAHGPERLHAELEPALAATVEPTDRKRVARLTELERAGIEPHASAEGLWTANLRHPTLLIGLSIDRDELADRIDRRVDAMLAAGAAEEARAAADAGASRTARAALGFELFLEGHDGPPPPEAVEAVKAAHRRYGRRQLTWMRRMEGVEVINRTGSDDRSVAREIRRRLG